MQLTQHKQVPVKVNAECDEKIAPLVLALNDVKGIFTLESCQEWKPGEAAVWFTYGTYGQRKCEEVAQLLQTISTLLSEQGLACGCRMSLEWNGNNDQPRVEMSVATAELTAIATTLRSIAPEISRRMTASACGM